MDNEEITLLIQVFSLALALLTVAFIIFFASIYKAKKAQQQKQKELEINFIEEISRTKSEIQNQTLNHIGRELHDNIGQLLAVAKIHSNFLVSKNEDEKIKELDKVLNKTIEETRLLSHTLNTERKGKFELISFIEKEIERIQATEKLMIQLEITDEQWNQLIEDDAIMIFRIIQEFLSNTLKHAGATTAQISLGFERLHCDVKLSDNGKGFDISGTVQGSGLYNIENRIHLLDGEMNFTSTNTGTSLHFSIPQKQTHDT